MKRLRSWLEDPELLGWVLTVVVAICGVSFMVFRQWWDGWAMPSLGDWGDYLGGVLAIIGLIWLIVTHTISEKRIADTQVDMRAQLNLTQRAVEAIVQMADDKARQSAVENARLRPYLVCIKSSGGTTGSSTSSTRPHDWVLVMRNDGECIELLNAEVVEGNAEVHLRPDGQCPEGGVFQVHFNASQPIQGDRAVCCKLKVSDIARNSWHVVIRLVPAQGMPTIQCERA